ncbi:Two-component response regulator evgA [Shigella dysenteriae 1617]|uniref:Two-component response regulator evgA n=1 Tax=Shigella dysenteriae 1617 TaxID=754093 RepID=A0A0A7A466_SHIDY|nr:Two-component response regulator evgA [Shigella dysenteriae 1617]
MSVLLQGEGRCFIAKGIIYERNNYDDILLLSHDQQNYDSLSKQEISVMRYILDGKDNNDIAEKMFISNKTVSTYKSRLMEKLECKSLMDLYTFAQRNKIG